MLGAKAGDVIGSEYKGVGTKTKDFPPFIDDSHFADDTVLTVAVAERLLHGGSCIDLFHDYCESDRWMCYVKTLIDWAGYRRLEPDHSCGNGSAMRVRPVSFAFDSMEVVLTQQG